MLMELENLTRESSQGTFDAGAFDILGSVAAAAIHARSAAVSTSNP